MHTQPIQEAVVSVFDIDRIVAPLTQVCGYVEHARFEATRKDRTLSSSPSRE